MYELFSVFNGFIKPRLHFIAISQFKIELLQLISKHLDLGLVFQSL